MMKTTTYYYLSILLLGFTVVACGEDEPEMKCMQVKASAYNSVTNQTRAGSDGTITAWGDTLRPDTKSVAISRDLLDSGMVHGTMIYIEGFKEPFKVNDKMNRRFTNKIDLHLGTDVQAAREFGNQELNICFEQPEEEQEIASVSN